MIACEMIVSEVYLRIITAENMGQIVLHLSRTV